jgi:hypothetical protein
VWYWSRVGLALKEVIGFEFKDRSSPLYIIGALGWQAILSGTVFFQSSLALWGDA